MGNWVAGIIGTVIAGLIVHGLTAPPSYDPGLDGGYEDRPEWAQPKG